MRITPTSRRSIHRLACTRLVLASAANARIQPGHGCGLASKAGSKRAVAVAYDMLVQNLTDPAGAVSTSGKVHSLVSVGSDNLALRQSPPNASVISA